MIFAANWKMHKTPQETRGFFRVFGEIFTPWVNSIPLPSDSQDTPSRPFLSFQPSLVFFPPALSLEAALEFFSPKALSSPTFFWGEIGCQNAYWEAKGAFTGENSAQALKDMGGKWILIGHSERRQLFQEKDSHLAKKVAFTQSLGLYPLLCIGETLEERQSGATSAVIRKQLKDGLALATPTAPLVIAYEPIWAIGTGQVASLDQVQEAHAETRKTLIELGFSSPIPILYGGSVKPDNAGALSQTPGVDGFLVGGASLEPSSFLEIIKASQSTPTKNHNSNVSPAKQ